MLSKVTTGFQITIPSVFRKKTNIQIGDYLDIEQEDGKLIITPVSINSRQKEAALNKFNAIFKQEITDDNFKGLSEEEVIKSVDNEIKKSRKSDKNRH